jgi:hypothetical protein
MLITQAATSRIRARAPSSIRTAREEQTASQQQLWTKLMPGGGGHWLSHLRSPAVTASVASVGRTGSCGAVHHMYLVVGASNTSSGETDDEPATVVRSLHARRRSIDNPTGRPKIFAPAMPQ